MSAITDVGGIRVGQSRTDRRRCHARLRLGQRHDGRAHPAGHRRRGRRPGWRARHARDRPARPDQLRAPRRRRRAHRRQRVRTRGRRRRDALARGARPRGGDGRAAWCRSCPPRWSSTCPSADGTAGRRRSSATPPPRAPRRRWPIGTVGAGAGARVGVLKGGVGTASVTLDIGVTVGAIVVVNAAGDVVDPATGLPWQADQIEEFGLVRAARRPDRRLRRPARRTQPAQHHDRRHRHRRGDEPGRVPTRRGRRP